VFDKHCKACQIWQRKKGTSEYDDWQSTHVCSINHTKSSGAMESSGAVEIFRRSIDQNGLIYNEYLGDGDTSSFNDVVSSDPYSQHGIQP